MVSGSTPSTRANDRSDLWSFWDDLVACGNDLPRMLQVIVERVATIVGEAAVLTVVSEDGRSLEPAGIHHEDPAVLDYMREVLGRQPYRIGQGIAGRVALERKPAQISGIDPATIVQFLQPHSRAFAERHPIRGVLIVPMLASGELVGTLGVVRLTSTAPYTDEDVVAVEALAERAALAIFSSADKPTLIGAIDFEAIYRHSMDGMLFTVPDGRVLGANPAACTILQLSEAEICTRGRYRILVGSDPATRAALRERNVTGRVRVEIPMRRGDGVLFTADVTSAIFTTPEGEMRACVIFRDVSQQVALRERLEQLEQQAELLAGEIHRDPLTQLRNRRGFLSVGQEAFAIGVREGRPLMLLFFDLDNLKHINDTKGHHFGDELLQRFATALAAETRDVDVSARLGGDEFVLLLFSADRADAERVIGRIRDAVAVAAGDLGSFSVGSADHVPGADETLDDLLHRADEAMYEAKARRRFGGSEQHAAD